MLFPRLFLVAVLLCSCAVSTQLDSTKESTQTSESTSFPTAASSPSPLSLITPIPTLSESQIQNFGAYLRETNRDCDLPCWWGIYPGLTTWQDAHNFLRSFGIVRTSTQFARTFFVTLPSSPSIGFLRLGVQTEDAIVDRLQIIQQLDLSELFFRYGQPDEVKVYAVELPTGRSSIHFVVFYHHIGLLAHFRSEVITQSLLTLCPMEFEDYVSILLWKSEETRELNEVGYPLLFQEFLPENLKSFESVSSESLSLEELFALVNKSEQACVHVRNNW